MNEQAVVPRREVEPLPDVNGETNHLLATADTLRDAWQEHLDRVSPEEFQETRRRTLRRHAIETGIIERLYDIDWGITEALVAEGITSEVATRAGGVSEATLDIVRTQLDALEMMAYAVKERRRLTVGFVKELHAAITRSQRTYEARDQFDRVVERELIHGEWKQFPNDVIRRDGSRLQFTPPEHVQSQVEQLIALHDQQATAHPIVRSAWLHHRFVVIHPFQDGNGRVARALTLMVLLQAHYAPLVVGRDQRVEYLTALDAANDGDLRPLVRLFGGLELVALKSELSAPVSTASHATGAQFVAREVLARLRDRRLTENEQRAAATEALAGAVQTAIIDELTRLGGQLEPDFRTVDVSARASVDSAAPGDDRASWWRGQIVHTARRVDFFANLDNGTWWSRLRITALGQALRFLVIVQRIGRGDSGVLAVTTFAEVVDVEPAESRPTGSEFRRAFEPTARDSVTLVHTNSVDERWPEIAGLIDRTLSVSLKYFVDQLG